MANKVPIVVILGMHRSGTSLIANFMHAAGVEFGQDLIPADEANAAGYWESRRICQIHEQIFEELNCTWKNPPLPLPVNWWRSPNIQELKGGLIEFVRSERERTDKIWGFKDPRTAVFLPLWQEIFDELQLEPLYILAVRHPGSVAASLARRDDFSFLHAQALWLRTNLDALSFARGHLRAIVDYDRWFEAGLEQARMVLDALDLSPSISEAQIAGAVDQIILPQLRHHSSKQKIACSPIATHFYSLLDKAAASGTVSDEIWTITETFENAADFLNIWNELVTERDDNIADNKKLLRKQKKRQRYSFAIIAVLLVILAIDTFILAAAYNWFK